MLWLLLACRGGDDARNYPDALARVAEAPGAAGSICAPLQDEALRADCVLAGAEALASAEPEAALALCASLPEGASRDECVFQIAERSDDPGRCAGAGRFADDCRLHLWSRAVRELLPRGAAPGQVEAAAEIALEPYGFAPDDNRPWSALYRELLARQRPLDRASCAAAPSAARQEACWNTGRSVFEDRMNVARDRHSAPCDGGAPPALLETTPDPELAAALEQRMKADLCAPR